MQQQAAQFPMAPEDVLKHYGKHLSQYEKEEIMAFDQIYYINLNTRFKGVGRYNGGELTCQDEDPDRDTDPAGIYNFGFDNAEADYVYEAKD